MNEEGRIGKVISLLTANHAVLVALAFAFLTSYLPPLTTTASAQVWPSQMDFVRPGLDWYTIETEHFNVHFHADSSGENASRSAQVVARIAEEIYEPITSLYDYEPERVAIILIDYEDYSNGAAYFFDNKIEIWAPALESTLRGAHGWLRNVITHEFTHIVQVQKTMRGTRRRPFYYLQYLDYEEVRRPDVLYGYPEAIVSYPVPVLNNPAWFAEGTAQYQRDGLGYDTWDSHRDMILRTQLLAGEGYTLDQMGTFASKTSIQREQVYNHGFAFTNFLAETYGEETLSDVSAQLARFTNWNVERAISDAIDEPAANVFDQWRDELTADYEARTQDIRVNLVEGDLIEAEGFTNLYPAYSPNGTQLAYISNKGQDYNILTLFVRDLETGEESSYRIDGLEEEIGGHACALGKPLIGGVSGRFSWMPDGHSVLYAKVEENNLGRRFSDLYRFDIEEEESTRLTHNMRAAEPAVSPDGSQLVFVRQGDGSTNLYLMDLTSDGTETSIRPLTSYSDGTQVSDPAWHPDGDWVYFGRSRQHARGIYRVPVAGGDVEAFFDQETADERSPAFSPDGQMVFSSDVSGIYNLFSRTDDGSLTALTNTTGGAFMPTIGASGEISFARYQHDGYKIAELESPVSVEVQAYTPPAITQKPADASELYAELNSSDDTDLHPLGPPMFERVREERRVPLTDGLDGDELGTLKRYGNSFTSFSVYPVVRIDRYSSPRRNALDAQEGRLGRELANTKVGFYASSREVLEGLSFLAGALVAPASRPAEDVADFFDPSRLNSLDRDLFLQIDYKKGLPMFRRSWSPQISLELYNLTRGVEDGLSFEESPCTACLPDTTYTDLSYSLFEVDVFARSKVSRNLSLELGYRYSPYSVTTEAFFSPEYGQSIPATTDTYFRGRAVMANLYFEKLRPSRSSDVIPEGLRVRLGYEYEPSELLDRFDVEDGRLIPVYEQFDFHRFSLDARYSRLLPGTFLGGAHGLSFRLKGSTIVGDEVDSFFNDYVGGLVGARGYPFYALGGNEALWFQAAYTFPLLPNLNRQVGFLYFDKVYARVYADAASAWTGSVTDVGSFRKDIGAELRVGLSSFYLFPTAFFASATYAIDSFDLALDDGFLTPEGQNFVTYGDELQFHFGALFEFDL